MTKKTGNTAFLAYQAAMNALSISQVHGMLFTALLDTLRGQQNVLPDAKLALIFHDVAARIDQATAPDSRTRELQKHMRIAVESVAKNLGVEIPPTDASGQQRRH